MQTPLLFTFALAFKKGKIEKLLDGMDNCEREKKKT